MKRSLYGRSNASCCSLINYCLWFRRLCVQFCVLHISILLFQLEKSRGEARQLAEQVRSLEQQVARVQTQMAEDIREKEDVIDKLKSENTKLRVGVCAWSLCVRELCVCMCVCVVCMAGGVVKVVIVVLCKCLQASVMRQKQQHESLRRLMDDLKDEMRAKVRLTVVCCQVQSSCSLSNSRVSFSCF